jgi:hypothetical protein
MSTSHDYDGTLTRVAPAGGVTAGTIYADSTDKVVYLAMLTAISGANFTAKVEGLVKSVAANTASAWTAGQPLAYATGSGFTHIITGGVIVAHAAAPRAIAVTTGDVILCLPSGNQGA